LLIFIVFSFFWNKYLKREVYKKLYAYPYNQELVVSDKDLIEKFDEKVETQEITVGGYDIKVEPVRHYAVTGRLVYVDRYNNFFGTYYRSAKKKWVYLYDAVVPLDLSIAHGKTAEPSNLAKMEFTHEYRFLSSRWYDNVYFKQEEINNNHIIPGTNNVAKGLEILKQGDLIRIEGYLVNWSGTGEFDYFDINTAINPGEISKDKLGGNITGLCRQIVVTKLIVDGYGFE
jgi:hypothetical protein